jgi:hypothetical protein
MPHCFVGEDVEPGAGPEPAIFLSSSGTGKPRERREIDALIPVDRERDPHERLYEVSERLRDGGIQPGGHLRWTLDRISSDLDVSSNAEQATDTRDPAIDRLQRPEDDDDEPVEDAQLTG